MRKLLFDHVLGFDIYNKKGLKQIDLEKNVLDHFAAHGSNTRPAYGLSVFRYYLITLFLFVIFLIFLSRFIYLQIFNHGFYKFLAESNKTRETIILPERGIIYSSDKQILARNRASFALEMHTSVCKSFCEKMLYQLQNVVDFDLEKALADVRANKPVLVVAQGIEKERALFIESNLPKYPGVNVIVYPIRDYLYPEVFAHSIGYVGLDETSLAPKITGKNGIEKTYDSYLTGISGNTISEVDATGKNYTVVTREDSLPGRDVEIYLNKDLSVKAFELLKKAVEEKKAIAGVVIAQNPQTGGILTMVNYPSFDAAKISTGITQEEYLKLLEDPSKPFFNRAISGAYPPGSTFKVITASAALSEKVVTPQTTIIDQGYISVGGSRFNNWKLDGHGEVNLTRAIQVSNDTYFYTIGGGYGDIRGVGIDALHNWAEKFGIGRPTGIDIEGEVYGNMPDGKARAWYLGDTYITAIGQGDVLTTPLQMNMVTGYFANGGYIYQPRVVKSIIGIKEFEPQILAKNLVSKPIYDVIREGLEQAVQPGGTGYPFFDFPQKHNGIKLGGKTGTSEYINSEGKPATHAWFTVFGPLENNKASIALTVFLEGGGAGSDDAAPIARELLDIWFK